MSRLCLDRGSGAEPLTLYSLARCDRQSASSFDRAGQHAIAGRLLGAVLQPLVEPEPLEELPDEPDLPDEPFLAPGLLANLKGVAGLTKRAERASRRASLARVLAQSLR